MLHGRVNPNLEKVLFCFDQTNRWPDDSHIIAVDESLLTGNPEMEYIMRRLASAAADPDVRQDMNVEDEYFSALEARDTTVMILNQKIEEKNAQLEQKNAQLEQKDAQLEQKDKALTATVKALKDAGLTAAQISQMTGLGVGFIETI